MAQGPYQKINLSSNIVVTWPFSFLGGITIADFNDINPNQNGWSISMPNATLASPGEYVIFNNISIYSFNIVAHDNITVISNVAAGAIIELYLRDNSTTNGTWGTIPYGSGASSVVSVNATSSDSTITITNGAITPPGGTINFQLPTNIANINKLTNTGIVSLSNYAPSIWKTVELIGGENIMINNPDGVSGNPIIDLNSVVTGLNSLVVGQMTFSGSIIDSNNVNGDISISTNGEGKIYLNGLAVDVNSNISGINNISVNGSFDNPLTPKAFVVFTDTITGSSNTIVLGNNANVTSVTGNSGTYKITFTSPMPDTNYGVHISLGTTGGQLPFVSTGYWIVRDTNAVTIVIVDASGHPVVAVPYGAIITIMATN